MSTLNQLRYNQTTQKLEAAGGTPEWNAVVLNNSGAATFSPSNTRWVDKGGSDLNDGGPTSPFLTIGAAMASIGNAASIADFNSTTNSRWLVEIGPGVYSESVSVPTRQIVVFHLSDAYISGNVSWSFDGTVIDTSMIQQAKLIIRGDDMRAQYPSAGLPLTGVSGNITLTVTGVHIAPFLQVYLMQTGVAGQFITRNSSLNFDTSLVLENAQVIGGISSDTGAAVTLYANSADTSANQSIGAVSGEVELYVLKNVTFSSTVVSTGQDGGRWTNVLFPAAAHNFSGYAGTVSMDATSFQSFYTNVPNKGTFTTVLLDGARGLAYTPSTPANWSIQPVTVQQALDLIAAKVNP
jgi:hypothetical protein